MALRRSDLVPSLSSLEASSVYVGGVGNDNVLGFLTLVPEVFLDFTPHERAGESPRSGEKEKPLVALDLNVTFMQTPGSGSEFPKIYHVYHGF